LKINTKLLPNRERRPTRNSRHWTILKTLGSNLELKKKMVLEMPKSKEIISSKWQEMPRKISFKCMIIQVSALPEVVE
jgi:hypothetical protein